MASDESPAGDHAEAAGVNTETMPSPPVGRVGTCRLCYDISADVIAPCLCKGSSKWIHRSCLNRWRTAGTNPRSLTHCCECGFQYHLRLHRLMNSDAEERHRQFMRMLAAQSLGVFLLTQLVVIAVGLLMKACDSHEWFVKLFHFPQDPGQDFDQPGDLLNALKHHKLTYYVAGLVGALCLIGLVISLMFCSWFLGLEIWCCPNNARSTRDSFREIPFSDADNCCNLCGECCIRGGAECCLRVSMTDGILAGSAEVGSVSAEGSPFLILLLVVVLAFIVLGFYAVLVALVTATQQAIQQYAQIQQMRLLAEEYVVQDLAGEDDLGDAAPTTPGQVTPLPGTGPEVSRNTDNREQEDLQQLISKDIAGIFSDFTPPLTAGRPASSYGTSDVSV